MEWKLLKSLQLSNIMFSSSENRLDFGSIQKLKIYFLFLDEERKSLMDNYHIACPLQKKSPLSSTVSNRITEPDYVSLVHSSCGFSHNKLTLSSASNIKVPHHSIGVCVRPFNGQDFNDIKIKQLQTWLEYYRLMSVTHVHLYVSGFDEVKYTKLKDKISHLASLREWGRIVENVEEVTSNEAAMNDCLYNNMNSREYTIVVNYDQLPILSDNTQDMYHVLKKIHSELEVSHGIKIESTEIQSPPTLVLYTKSILTTAAGYFVPLNKNIAFNILNKEDIIMTTLDKAKIHPATRDLLTMASKLTQ